MNPPIIQVPPEVERRAAVGQDVTLTCTVFGSPRPLVIWMNGQEVVTGIRLHVTGNGDLDITVGRRSNRAVQR